MTAVIAGAVRTCIGRSGGVLRNWHSVDLLAHAFEALLDRSGIGAGDIDQVWAASRSAVGEQALNVGRNALLAAGWPVSIPAFTIEGDTSTGVTVFQAAVASIDNGADAVVVGGVEAASRVPLGASTGIASGKPYGPRLHDRFEVEGGLVAPNAIAERLADTNDVSRLQMDAWTLESVDRAAGAVETDVAKSFVVAVPLRRERALDDDPWLDHDDITRYDDVTALKPSFEVGGRMTAANMARPADGSSAVLIVSESLARRRGLDVMAHSEAVSVRGTHPLHGDSGARLLGSMCDVDGLDELFVHEDCAVTPVVWSRVVSPDRLNRDGGALALGDTGGAAAVAAIGRAAHGIAAGARSSAVLVAGTLPQAGVVHLVR